VVTGANTAGRSIGIIPDRRSSPYDGRLTETHPRPIPEIRAAFQGWVRDP